MASASMPEPGQAAPSFSGQIGTGEAVSLADYSGRWLLLYFYPRDNTPGCTKQACDLRDNFERLQGEGVAVLGVSADDETSHQQFTEKFDLPFPLLADTEREAIDAYGVWGEKNMYGIKRQGILRTSFLIDPKGTIRHVFRRPQTAGHADEVLAKKVELEG